MTTNIKLGDPGQNSYVTATMADLYFSDRRDTSAWDTLVATTKTKTLKHAARDMNRFNFIESRYYDFQGLAFPLSDHEVVTGNCATPITDKTFKNTNLRSTTYGVFPTSYWKYGSVHITSGTPIYDIRLIASSNVVTGSITIASRFSATPTVNTKFILFAPIFKEVRDAQCEQALFILDSSGMDSLQNYKDIADEVEIGDVRVQFRQGNQTKIPLSPVARKLLSRWIRRRSKIARR